MRFLALLATLLVALVATPAAAHDYIVGSTPAEGQVLEQAPTRVEIEFSADIIPASPALLIQNEAGEVVWEATPELEGRLAYAPFPDLESGNYRLNWSLVSSDGHRVEGSISFALATGAGTGPDAETPVVISAPVVTATPEATATPGTPTAPAAADSSPLLWIALATAALVGGLVGLGMRQRSRR